MDCENNGKPYCLMDDLGGFTHNFQKHPCIFLGRTPRFGVDSPIFFQFSKQLFQVV